nr:capsular biosynthesis protein [Sansalvadorimonas sp. 2012CJ34-2]
MGDCRLYHRMAKQVCESLDVRVLVFEEGYLRPDTITLEEGGVNALTGLDLSLEHLKNILPHKCQSPVSVGPTMRSRTVYASAYYWAALLGERDFPGYQHHRAFHPVVEGAKWIKGSLRKNRTRFRDSVLERELQTELSGRFYMVALQVHDDSQMRYHSDYDSVEAFITETVHSFARHAPKDTVLVLKHHPMDRGYTHYGLHIKALELELNLAGRLVYCHDLRLPGVYNHCRGVVTVNSTVGPSALLHHIPVKVMGKAMYDLPGLTSQCSLDNFWSQPEPVDSMLFRQLQTYLFDQTQINGSFFSHYDLTCCNVLAFCQQRWPEIFALPAQVETIAPVAAMETAAAA